MNFDDALLARAERVDAWASTRSAIREMDSASAPYPSYFSRAKGGHLWDVDGREYVDLTLGYGPIVLGHANDEVNSAVVNALASGTCVSPLWSPRQVELTELLVRVIPGAQKAFLLKTGSDATAAAVRLARIFTGREKVLKWGYNGWHDWTAPRPAGVPRAVQQDTLHFTFNDEASVEAAFSAHPDQIACVIMMPFELEPLRPGFLHAVRDIAHRHGALFILDDMRSGFRIALGGTQEHFSIVADLATFSKAMANGFAISAVVGRADILEGMAKTHMTSTFFANAPEMAAAIATISILRDTDALATMHRLANRFYDGLDTMIASGDIPARLRGYPISPFVEFTEAGDGSEARRKNLFYRTTLERGVFLHPNHQWYFCAAHSDADIDQALDACEMGFAHALGRERFAKSRSQDDGAAAEDTITVITLTRDRANLLQRAVKSVQGQNYAGDIEHLVVIDDDPETVPILARMPSVTRRGLRWILVPRADSERCAAASDRRSVYPRLARLLNLGARSSTSKWLAFLDDDNEFEAEHLESLMRCARETNCRAVYSHRAVYWPDGSPYLESFFPGAASLEEGSRIYEMMCRRGVCQTGTNIIRDRVDELQSRFVNSTVLTDDEPLFLVDQNLWLIDRSLFMRHPIPEVFTASEIAANTCPDDKMLEGLVRGGVKIVSSQRPTVRYYLGGISTAGAPQPTRR